MKKIFVTSIGTEIGKTFVTCALTYLLKDIYNKSIHTIKPVISGFDVDETPNDISEICKVLEVDYEENINEVARYIYKAVLSPDMAGKLEKNEVQVSEIEKFIRKFKNEYLIIEGIGGAFVPLNSKSLTTNLIKKTADKVILVTGSFLGSLSYTIATLKALELEKITPDVIIVTQRFDKNSKNYIDEAETVKSLENFTDIPIITLKNIRYENYKEVALWLEKSKIKKWIM